jgi:hypothetical protein
MNSKMTLVVLSLAIAFSGTSVAVAGGKKAPVDPRTTAASAKKTHQVWCDIDPSCNGWGQALTLAQAGKIKY